MLRPIVFALVCVFNVSHVLAGQVPGTSVSLTPPEGFIEANRFPGFMEQATSSSIMVSEIPGPYREITAGFSDRKRMRAQGMLVLSKSPAKVDGHSAMLFHIEQSANGTLFRKWLVAVDRAGATTLIVASYPKAEARQQEDPLKAAILTAVFGQPRDPAEALAFSATPIAPFEIAKVMGQNMILSPDGRLPGKDENVPFMILGLSASQGLSVPDQKTFAERRVTRTAAVMSITVDQSTPIRIGNLSGYVTIAKGVGEDAATPLTIYQVLLFDTSGYCVILGIAPSAEQGVYVPIFEKIANTFVMKDSHYFKSMGSDE